MILASIQLLIVSEEEKSILFKESLMGLNIEAEFDFRMFSHRLEISLKFDLRSLFTLQFVNGHIYVHNSLVYALKNDVKCAVFKKIL